MTVTEKSSRKIISGAGWVNPLTHDYMIENASYAHVFADGIELVNGVDYTVTDVNNPAGYSITITVPGSWAPTSWVLDARPPIAQGKDLTLGGQFGAKYEDGIDQLARRLQRVWDLARRGLKTSLTTPVGDDPYTLPAPEADKFIGWNPAGTDLENKSVALLGGVVVSNDTALTDSSPTEVPSEHAVKVYVDAETTARVAGDALKLAKASNLSDLADIPQARENIAVPVYVANRAAMKALNIAKDGAVAIVYNEGGRNGTFIFDSSNVSAFVTLDTLEGIYAAPTSAPTGASGAWVRLGNWAVDGALLSWFGGVADASTTTGIGTDNLAIFNTVAALTFTGPAVKLGPGNWYFSGSINLPQYKGLVGVGHTINALDARTLSTNKGTILTTNMAAGALDGNNRPQTEFIRVNKGSFVKGFGAIWCGHSDPTVGGWTPTNTPWFIRCGRFTDTSFNGARATGVRVDDVRGYAFTHGFEFQRGADAESYINYIGGHFFVVGFSADGIHDVFRITGGCHLWRQWSVAAPVTDYMTANYRAYEFGRIDGLQVNGGLFSIGAHEGCVFIGSRSPDFPTQPAAGFEIDTLYSDGSVVGLKADSTFGTVALTGHIGHLILNRSNTQSPVNTTIANDWHMDFPAFVQIKIDHAWATASGFAGRGGILRVTGTRPSYVQFGTFHYSAWDKETCTITIASPGVVTIPNHLLNANDPITFSTSGALPTGLTAGTQYYVKTVLDANTFTVSATPGGAAINTSGSQSGTHYLSRGISAVDTTGNSDTRTRVVFNSKPLHDLLVTLPVAPFYVVTDLKVRSPEWRPFTPTITAFTGTLTTVSSIDCKYKIEGDTCMVDYSFVITTNGTGATAILATLPFQGKGRTSLGGTGVGTAGKQMKAVINNTVARADLTLYDNTYPAADAATLKFTAAYEVG